MPNKPYSTSEGPPTLSGRREDIAGMGGSDGASNKCNTQTNVARFLVYHAIARYITQMLCYAII